MSDEPFDPVWTADCGCPETITVVGGHEYVTKLHVIDCPVVVRLIAEQATNPSPHRNETP